MMQYPELFDWWAAVITAGILFIALVSLYLYVGSRKKRKTSHGVVAYAARLGADFIFVWVLLGLLSLYIFSISRVSIFFFVAGNIMVGLVLIAYLLKNTMERPR
jgi:hypothetical protein